MLEEREMGAIEMADEKKTEEVTPEELEALNKDIESATKNFVSAEVQKKIEEAKAQAKAEAEKDFNVQQRIKELEAEKERLAKEKEEQEKKAAEELSSLKSKVDAVISSKATIASQNPFKSEGAASFTDDEANVIERASFEALLNKNR